ncbi:fused MFS/spermidine synthase [Novosphingobium profundi]|uniref:spermidine synthase n=1 Tax=Novosphingobium profundi TaxID=1774954 RepID=UPI001BDA1551|nr:fused MFS/spermidine synthase [Novosphingobium profundi]MBT0668835.1 fused MFS/spermidine synthase [Novosphingobium profundi]
MSPRGRSFDRALFLLAILLGSFLLFLVQPMVARMALPLLGGAPNVWNSAMLVYQALLLGGYAYAHALGCFAVRTQALIHGALLLLAALTLPIGLVALPPAPEGSEVLWVPLLLALSVGPVFLAVSAQAPLLQRWFATDPDAGQPWALYAASNLGSFGGLLAYPLLAEPLLSLQAQSRGWALGYGLLVLCVIACGWARRDRPASTRSSAEQGPAPTWRGIALWLVLAAVPSGLMLSTTTHLTTDIFAAPLLWVIPLGLYLLSFVVAFADRRGPARGVGAITPVVLLLGGGYAMASSGIVGIWAVGLACLLLLCVCVTLHARLYELRPESGWLTQFYLVLAAGGALGGLFTALLAPVLFDWTWEHPVLVLAAAALVPLHPLLAWRTREDIEPGMARLAEGLLLALAVFLGWQLKDLFGDPSAGIWRMVLTVFLVGTGVLLMATRAAFVVVLFIAMIGQGGAWTLQGSWAGQRTRSYFGIYTLRDDPQSHLRILAHGTTLHGKQSLDPAHAHDTLSYYGPGSGVALGLGALPALYGPSARVGVVGLGAGSLACLSHPGQSWTFFEIDPVILRYSREGAFTFLRDCTPRARVVIGDARLRLAHVSPAAFDTLVIDAFSSDSIPLHLLTREAFAIYERALGADGLLLVHISNRYIDLVPVIAALARERGLVARAHLDLPEDMERYSPSRWIALARKRETLDRMAAVHPEQAWTALPSVRDRAWSDDHASILPYIRWSQLTGTP